MRTTHRGLSEGASTHFDCDFCGTAAPATLRDDLLRLRAAGWRPVVLPLVWIDRWLAAAEGPDDPRTGKFDACPTCSGHIRNAFVLVQRLCSGRRLLSPAPVAALAAPSEEHQPASISTTPTAPTTRLRVPALEPSRSSR